MPGLLGPVQQSPPGNGRIGVGKISSGGAFTVMGGAGIVTVPEEVSGDVELAWGAISSLPGGTSPKSVGLGSTSLVGFAKSISSKIKFQQRIKIAYLPSVRIRSPL